MKVGSTYASVLYSMEVWLLLPVQIKLPTSWKLLTSVHFLVRHKNETSVNFIFIVFIIVVSNKAEIPERHSNHKSGRGLVTPKTDPKNRSTSAPFQNFFVLCITLKVIPMLLVLHKNKFQFISKSHIFGRVHFYPKKREIKLIKITKTKFLILFL